MLRYQSRRHRYLMFESEQALEDAAAGDQPREKRIARHVLDDTKIHRLWESRHADLLVPVAEQRKRASQIFGLRDVEVRLLHRRALIRCIRRLQISGPQRDKLFHVFYGPRDTTDAIIAEHRQYSLAVSSRVSTDHLINVMHDPVSFRLLREYEELYTQYFELYCKSACSNDRTMKGVYRMEMSSLRRRALNMIRRIHREEPEDLKSTLERQALLARSGRYPIRNYMVG